MPPIPRRDAIAAVLAALVVTSSSTHADIPTQCSGHAASDPIFAALVAARLAKAEARAAIHDLVDTDPTSVRKADAACDRSWDARSALSKVMPTTPFGLRALIQFHASAVIALEPDSYGALALGDLVRAVDALLEAHASPG